MIDYTKNQWLTEANKFEGKSEEHDDKELSLGWPLSGLPSWHTVRGPEHAWCAMFVNYMLYLAGERGTGRADAISFKNYGVPCDDVDGAILVIEHPSGRHHVTLRRSGKLFGGNQRNMVCAEDLAPGDKIITIRWPEKVV